MTAKIRMLGDQPAQGLGNGRPFYINGRLLACILPKRRRYMDLRHG
jgi:hypothetical protein